MQLCLPTEAQWEYACRAGTTTRYAFGNTLNKKQANFGASETIDVASYLPSSWGLYDMHGGVYEWCQDLSKYDITKSVVDPQGGTLGINRVFRGGSWNSSSGDCSSYHRDFGHPAYCDRLTSGNRSFRLARSL